MTTRPLPDPVRLAPQRYFNLFRLLVAGLFLVAGRDLNLGNEAPQLFLLFAFAYLGLVLLFGFPDAMHRLGFDRLVSIQVLIDIAILTAIMWVSGGYRSGIAVMMMVYVAAAGLVAEGRMVLFFAAVATVAVLGENAWRTIVHQGATDFLLIGIVCIGFFAIAFTARLLARRAKFNESLAAMRGEALGRQQAVNERIIRDMQDGVIVLSEDGRIRQFNPRASVLLGVSLREGEAITRIDPAFAPYCDPDAAVQGVVQRFGPGGKQLRCRTVGADVGGDASSGDLLIYLTDHEEIQRHVQQLKLAALGRLTASMAHEIRNPLSAVTQAADLLGEEKRADVQVRLLRIINDNARRIERLVRDVLALGKHEHILREALPLRPFVEQLIEEFGLKGDHESKLFDVEIGDEITIVMDRAHLHQVLANLLYNARRYCSGTPGSIRLHAIANAQEGSGVCLHVVDDGPGISKDNLAHLFDPFFTTDAKGTGLGLYIARELCEANDATLEFVDNAPGAHFVLCGRSQA